MFSTKASEPGFVAESEFVGESEIVPMDERFKTNWKKYITGSISLVLVAALFGVFLIQGDDAKDSTVYLSTATEGGSYSAPSQAPPHDIRHIASRTEYESYRDQCEWISTKGRDNRPLTIQIYIPPGSDVEYPDENDYTLEDVLDAEGEYCIIHHSERSWLIVHRVNLGELIPGRHYSGGVGTHYNTNQALQVAGNNTEIRLDFEPFWQEIENSPDFDPNKKGWFSSGQVWPMIKKDEKLTPASYPPLHMHHGFWMSPETPWKHEGDEISITYSAETYCEHREDHCLWLAFPDNHGYEWPFRQDLVFNIYVETMWKTHCPDIPFIDGEIVIEAAAEFTLEDEAIMTLVSPEPPGYGRIDAGNPLDYEHETNIDLFAPHLLTAPVNRSIMSWESMKIPAGHLIPQDQVDGWVRAHLHPSHSLAMFLFRGSEEDIGLNMGDFVRDKNILEHNVPLLLGDEEKGNGYSVAEAQEHILGHVSNGAATAGEIEELAADADAVTAVWDELNTHKSFEDNPRNKLVCVWTGPAAVYEECDHDSTYNEGFDRQPRWYHAHGQKCDFEWKDGEEFTWVFFNYESQVEDITLHATFHPVIVYDYLNTDTIGYDPGHDYVETELEPIWESPHAETKTVATTP